MKSSVLKLLKKHSPDFLSGEQISNSLQVSRTAIWKHIKSLREDGYIIESHPRVGYRLASAPDRLYPEEIEGLLDTRVIGRSIVYLEKTISTNKVAKELATAGAAEGTIIVAEEQTGGRGRLGRKWFSPKEKGIWVSFILRPFIVPMEAPKLTLVAAIALARTINYTGIKPGIKWPNDLLVHGKKISGVLTEMSAEMEKVNFIILGLGININTRADEMPEEIRDIATSLYIETGKEWNRIDFFAKLCHELEEVYLEFSQGNFLNLMEEWKRYCMMINKPVEVFSQGANIKGKAIDLDEEGALIVRTNEGKDVKIMAGEVSMQ